MSGILAIIGVVYVLIAISLFAGLAEDKTVAEFFPTRQRILICLLMATFWPIGVVAWLTNRKK